MNAIPQVLADEDRCDLKRQLSRRIFLDTRTVTQEEIRDNSDKISGHYEGTALCLVIAEVPLLLMSMYYYGSTAHFANTKGYYLIDHLEGHHAYYAHLMYAGALLALFDGVTPLSLS